MLKTGTIHVILNASAGLRGKRGLPAMLTRVFSEHGCEAEIHPVAKGTDLRELTRQMIRDGASAVVAGGGDGTINAVASALSGTDVALGILPAGTINHFARDLKIPFDLEAAARVIAAGHEMRADIGEVNGKHFINNAVIGWYPRYRFRREWAERHGRFRFLAMLSAVLHIFRLNPVLTLRIDAEGQSITRQTPFLMAANNCHQMEGWRLGSRERLNEGRLWFYVMHRLSRWGLAGLLASLLLGRFSKREYCDTLNAREVTVTSQRKAIGVSLDGEVVRMQPPLVFRSLPGALRVIVPAEVSHS